MVYADLIFTGTVRVLYVKGGGARPTHNHAETCDDVAKLSRLVVLIYSVLADTLLSPLTVSVPVGSAPDSPTFLYLHQENLVTSLDAHCPRAVESKIKLHPGLFMLTVNSKLVDMFRQLESHSKAICDAADGLSKEMRKRKKDETLKEKGAGSERGTSAAKRRKL